ncbi:MAG: hypothetical protein CL811_10550 [Colwelliaceae bacterium]|jgi:hypothetical protein|nr:hypothetical protein [Colwelliaceae bacterium]|tara:strand:+ start:4528 stop:4710 length:183 start_codon:yes stop_codon:yes gene_type:complete
MEQTEQIQEPIYRVNMKQSAKGGWYADMTVRANTQAELETKFKDMKIYVLDQLKELNGGV